MLIGNPFESFNIYWQNKFSVKLKPRIRCLSLLARLKIKNQHRNWGYLAQKYRFSLSRHAHNRPTQDKSARGQQCADVVSGVQKFLLQLGLARDYSVGSSLWIVLQGLNYKAERVLLAFPAPKIGDLLVISAVVNKCPVRAVPYILTLLNV